MSINRAEVDLASLSHELKQPTGESGRLEIFTDPETKLALCTYAVDRRNGDSKNTVLLFQPWSDYVARKFAQQRMDLIADTYNARVIGVDNLGVGYGTSYIPADMRREIRAGNFQGVSELQWKAIQHNSMFNKDDDLTLSYYSLGTTMAMSMAAHAPEGISIDQMILWDCAAIKPPELKHFPNLLQAQRRFGKLALNFLGHGGDGWKDYLSHNPDWVEKPSGIGHLARRIMEQPAGHYVYPYGMAQKTAFQDVALAHEKGVLSPDGMIHVVNGSESRVSPTEANDRFAAQLEGMKAPTPTIDRVVLLGETHAVQDDFHKTAAAFDYLAQRRQY